MKFYKMFSRDERQYDIDDVVEERLIEREGGCAERAGYTAENTARAVAFLFKRLHEEGMLSRGDVMTFAHYGFEIVEEDDAA